MENITDIECLFEISIIDTKHKLAIGFNHNHIFNNISDSDGPNDRGFQKLILLTDLLNEENSYIINDTVTFEVKINLK